MMDRQKIMLVFLSAFFIVSVVSYFFIFQIERNRHKNFIRHQAVGLTNASSDMINRSIKHWQAQLKLTSQAKWVQEYFKYYKNSRSMKLKDAKKSLKNKIIFFEHTFPGFYSLVLVGEKNGKPDIFYSRKPSSVPLQLLERGSVHPSILYNTKNKKDKLIVFGEPVFFEGKKLGTIFLLIHAIDFVRLMEYGIVTGVNDALFVVSKKGNILLTLNKSQDFNIDHAISTFLAKTQSRTGAYSEFTKDFLDKNIVVTAPLDGSVSLLSLTTPTTIDMPLGAIKNKTFIVSASTLVITMIFFLWMLVHLRKSEEEKKSYQEQFFQSQKLESLGLFTSGIAHDYNNIAMSVKGYAELIKESAAGNKSIVEYAEIILQSISRCNDIATQLLTFSQKSVGKLEVVQFNDLVDESVKLLEKLPKISNIKIQTNLADKLWVIQAESSKLVQVIMNLGVNAVDALEGDGEIFITTENFTAQKSFRKTYKNIVKNKYLVKFSMRDTGPGIPSEIQNRVFDPFFTTKEVGKGTGLGLSSAYRIVKQFHGVILVKSNAGEGATFEIYLPAMEE